MAYDVPPRLLSKSLVACAVIAIAGACAPSAVSAQDVVTEVPVPFAIAPAPFVGADVIVGDPYYRYPAYSYGYAPADYRYPPTYGMVCGYDAWDRWVCYPR